MKIGALQKMSAWGWATVACTATFVLVYGTACWLQYHAFGYSDFDMAIHVQSVWNLLRGSLDCSILQIRWPGNHANWILVLLTPFFALAPSPLTLLALQTVALALTCWPIHLLAAREFGDERYGFLFTAAYCFYAPVGHVALYEFHPVAFSTPLLMAAFYCARINNDRWFAIWSLLAATSQENIPLLVITLCLYRFFTQRNSLTRTAKVLCGALAGTMAIWFYLCVAIIGPYFNQGAVGWTNLYSHFGKSGSEIAQNILLRPDLVLRTLLRPNCGEFLLKLLSPLLFLPLLAPEILLIALPSFAQHLLSARPTEQSIEFHYTAYLTPFVIAAAVVGAARLNRWLQIPPAPRWAHRIRCSLIAALGLTIITTNFIFGGLHRIRRQPERFRHTKLDAEAERLIAQIPRNASVICTFDAMARFAMRRECYSMHYVMGGRKTLSYGRSVNPKNLDFAVVNFADNTFDSFYHTAIRQPDGLQLPSSEKLIRLFFMEQDWHSHRRINTWTVFHARQASDHKLEGGGSQPTNLQALSPLAVSNDIQIVVWKSPVTTIPHGKTYFLRFQKKVATEEFIPYPFYWVRLEMTSKTSHQTTTVLRGPFWLLGREDELWEVILDDMATGEYDARIIFYDRKAQLDMKTQAAPAPSNFPMDIQVPIGQLIVTTE